MKHVAGMLFLLLLTLLLTACRGASKEESDKPDCPSTPPGAASATVTTSVDPRCVQRATETSHGAADQMWKGTIGGSGVNIPESPSCPNPATVYSGDFTMTVTPDGNATLTGHMVTTSCGQSIDTPFNRSGRKTGSRISFPPIETFPWQLDLEISGGSAAGSNQESIPTHRWTMTYRATCQNC